LPLLIQNSVEYPYRLSDESHIVAGAFRGGSYEEMLSFKTLLFDKRAFRGEPRGDIPVIAYKTPDMSKCRSQDSEKKTLRKNCSMTRRFASAKKRAKLRIVV
jgi:hypothetical protein